MKYTHSSASSLEREDDHQTLETKLEDIFGNLYYTWNKELYELIDNLDGFNWRKTKSPSVIIHRFIEESSIKDMERVLGEVDVASKGIDKYFEKDNWYEKSKGQDDSLAKFETNPVLYFSAEYGLVDWLQIYSGGLGVLSGDFIKQASDHALPIVSIGLFYHSGYFHQDIDPHGMQNEHYIPQDPAASMLKLVRDENGYVVESVVRILDHEVYVRAWELNVGRLKVYLLDTNYEKNERYEDRMITAHLYGGNEDTRIRQEIVLGIGGYRFAKKMQIEPSVIHLNEGHASFALFAKLAEDKSGISFHDKIEKAKANIMFTNHTLNPAGNDKFEYELLDKYLSPYLEEIGAESMDEIFDLGNDQLYSKGVFSMTILGLKGSKISNAVSLLHGEAAKKLWPDYPMVAITNGVHMPTWVAKPIQEELDTILNIDWRNPVNTESINWDLLDNLDNEKLWEIHTELRKSMVDKINATLGTELRHDVLTVVWTRRFAAYKRPQVFLNNLDRLAEIVHNADMPVQFLIGGKAHPRDTKGKELLQKVIQTTLSERFKNKVVFMTGYNWNLARYLVSGADIWLNNPIRYEEASGTSGMKAGANGVLQFTTLED